MMTKEHVEKVLNSFKQQYPLTFEAMKTVKYKFQIGDKVTGKDGIGYVTLKERDILVIRQESNKEGLFFYLCENLRS